MTETRVTDTGATRVTDTGLILVTDAAPVVTDPLFVALGPRLDFIALGRIGMRANNLRPAIAAGGETRPVTFDFSLQLAPGVVVTSIDAMLAAVLWGDADATPDARWQGSAAIVASLRDGIAGHAVAQQFGNVPGASRYLLQCQATASDGSHPWLETELSSYVPGAGP